MKRKEIDEVATYRTNGNRSAQKTGAQNAQTRRDPRAQGKAGMKTKQNRAPSLSPEEMRRREEKRRLLARERREEKKRLAALRRRRRRQIFRASFALSLVFLCLYWCFVAFAIITREKTDKDALPLMIFTEGQRKEDKKYEKEEFLIGGTKYLPITELSPYFSVSQFGDGKTRSFQLPDGQWATFYLGTEEAVINSVHVSLSAPSLLIDGDLYLPLDFYASKMTCFDFGQAVSSYGADVLTVKKADPGFYFFSAPPSPTLAKDSIPQVTEAQ